jgi:hypothetical protein
MAQPTNNTRTAAHLLVGAAVAILAARALGKNAWLVSAVIGMAAHEALDAPVAKVMAEAGIQL